ncbi:flavin-dependent oxidoreductase [Pseudorhodoplanes sinuspersici]|uniref:Flavin-dependent oxidoreductase n=1 Tax=Pseudorhodoplanes sinuspersici TaxID=1235591 RepID=A0A1W6ZP07_9HYPH|nr:flavin-dependent oxidoreductase [Pseudorhodoplanes sinuspersici]ARP99101.1 flavin-dependent oxidoreductase [Pseudorhodoplanes sinuspersici]RKE69250.1 2-polyprenyl-6-methoxyphenol hydroxylase-like FAD-dependent oxidoreductase [Pseudorhodoplanes sinuspersici]
MTNHPVIIAGGGIGGLATALTLHQIGAPCVVFEAVNELRPLGVGINLQPNAVRELYDLGIAQADLDRIGVPAKEWALVGLNGNDIYSEPRGLLAGYNWPQYSVHRGQLHMLLHQKVVEQMGPQAVRLGSRVTGYRKNDDGSVSAFVEGADGTTFEQKGALLIGADGIHSAIRAQMHPGQPPIHWGGAVMWRGTTRARPIRTDASFVGLGTHRQRVVFYPISHPDPQTGLSMINWIAEVTMDNAEGWKQLGWFRQVPTSDFAHHFENWVWDWLDVPALIRQSDAAFENPMIDRDPVPTWRDGPVVLLGDAAHAMYPTGSNGASQAIVDARVLGAAMIEHGVTPGALKAYDEKLCGPISQLVLRNRGAGPFGLLNIVDERCGGTFDNIDDVIPANERAAFMAGYKAAAGFAIETLNNAPRTIAEDARVQALGSSNSSVGTEDLQADHERQAHG